MQFQVPQFIEHEAKIVGPFTFKQFIFVGAAGGILFILYFIIPQLEIFLVAALILAVGSLGLAFFKVSGRSLPIVIGNLFGFLVSPKIYLWKKKKAFISFNIVREKKPKIKKEEEQEELPLKIAEKSKLKKLRSQLETGVR